MRCRETSGVLFNHPCTMDATLSCVKCSKPICSRHMRHVHDKPHCMSCVRQEVKERRERGHNIGYENDPYFFYYHSGWDDPYVGSDYALFDGGDDAGDAYGAAAMSDWAGS